MKYLFKILLFLAVIAISSKVSAQRACHASDKDYRWNWGYKHGQRNHKHDGLASAAVQPVDWVLGNGELAYDITTPARVPADKILPPY